MAKTKRTPTSKPAKARRITSMDRSLEQARLEAALSRVIKKIMFQIRIDQLPLVEGEIDRLIQKGGAS
jgi:hypothetical protein